MAIKLTRVEAGKYRAYGERYLIRQEPETPWAGGPRMWLVYDETYGGDGICMEPVETLSEVRPKLESYHAEIVALEAQRDDEQLPDHQRVAATIRLHVALTPEQLAEQFEWPLDRVQAALDHPKQTAAKSSSGPFGSESH